MTEQERLMYEVLGKISESSAPIVFKGALITKLILAENGFTALDRSTKDIDANWTGAPPSMDAMVDSIRESLGEMRERFDVIAIRGYAEKMSAGISVCARDSGKEIFTMDIDIRPIIGSRIYQYGEARIRGVLANEILADKITVLSGAKVFRRSKDLIDVYALSHCVKVLTAEIFGVIASKHHDLGDFAELLTRRGDVEHAYEKLARVDGKPAFDVVYSCLAKFLQPFAAKDQTPRVWDSDKLSWDKPALLETLRENQKKVDAQFPRPSQSKHKGDTEH